MALYIDYAVSGTIKTMIWNVNSPKPLHMVARTTVEIRADGDELTHIGARFSQHNGRAHMPSIPWANSSHQFWFGDLAKTIVANL